MSYNVTISGKEYEGIDKVHLPITGENTYAEFFATGPEDVFTGNFTSFESDTAFDIGKNPLRAYCFYSCKKLERVSIPNATYLVSSLFESCIALTSVNVQSAATAQGSVFAGCTALEEITLPALTAITGKMFNNCSSLKKVDASVAKSVDSNAFNNCKALEALILRSATMATLANVSAFGGTPIAAGAASNTCFIYVPSALVDTYKAATNWSTFANQFRAIEDYPDICG